MRLWAGLFALALGSLALAGGASAAGAPLLGASCRNGEATDPKTGRKFILDYPCDL